MSRAYGSEWQGGLNAFTSAEHAHTSYMGTNQHAGRSRGAAAVQRHTHI